MSSEQLATRYYQRIQKYPQKKFGAAELSSNDFQKLVKSSQELESALLFIDDTPAIPVSTLRTRARRLLRQHDLSLIIVDYLQLMRPSAGQRTDNRVQEVSVITQGLKAIAKELNVPILALFNYRELLSKEKIKDPF